MKSKKNPLETGFHALFLSCGILSVGFVLFITVYLVISGVPAIGQVGIGKFLLGENGRLVRWISAFCRSS